MIDRYTKVSLSVIAVASILLLASCSDSDTSTGVTTGRQAANDASTQTVMHQATAGTGEHSDTDPGHSHSPDQQHGEAGNVVTATTVLALAAIPASTCGNLIQEAGEQCDGGPSGNATCNADCTLKTQRGEIIATVLFCGNGIVDSGEQCDDRNDSNEDSCTQYCKIAVCGDGYTQKGNGEQCDDKNKVDTDACNNKCQRQQSTTVVTTTTVSTVDNTGGGTDIVLTDTMNDKTADVVTSSDDSGTLTQRAALSGGSNDTPMVEATPSDKPKEGDAQTDAWSSAVDCVDKSKKEYVACVNLWDANPRCQTWRKDGDWKWGDEGREEAEVGCAQDGWDGMTEACQVSCEVTGCVVGTWRRWVGLDDLKPGDYYYAQYRWEKNVHDCRQVVHENICRKEFYKEYEQCEAEYADAVGKP